MTTKKTSTSEKARSCSRLRVAIRFGILALIAAVITSGKLFPEWIGYVLVWNFGATWIADKLWGSIFFALATSDAASGNRLRAKGFLVLGTLSACILIYLWRDLSTGYNYQPMNSYNAARTACLVWLGACGLPTLAAARAVWTLGGYKSEPQHQSGCAD